jgi:hypothetical protein
MEMDFFIAEDVLLAITSNLDVVKSTDYSAYNLFGRRKYFKTIDKDQMSLHYEAYLNDD